MSTPLIHYCQEVVPVPVVPSDRLGKLDFCTMWLARKIVSEMAYNRPMSSGTLNPTLYICLYSRKRKYETFVAIDALCCAACRLREPEKGERKRFSMVGYKYRFTGRTQYQSQQAADQITRSTQSVNRVAGDRFTWDRTLDPGIYRHSRCPLHPENLLIFDCL